MQCLFRKKFRKSVDFRNRNSEWPKILEFSEYGIRNSELHPIPAPHIFGNSDDPSHIFIHPDMPSQTLINPVEPSPTLWNLLEPLDRDTEPRSNEAVPSPKTPGPDNTVGPIPKISGYVFNTLQTNSAAHVPNTNINPINEDTNFCGLNLYETIFQNWLHHWQS